MSVFGNTFAFGRGGKKPVGRRGCYPKSPEKLESLMGHMVVLDETDKRFRCIVGYCFYEVDGICWINPEYGNTMILMPHSDVISVPKGGKPDWHSDYLAHKDYLSQYHGIRE